MGLTTTVRGRTYTFKDLKDVLARANERKSGDELAGVAAMLEQADEAFCRVEDGLRTYAANYGAYMTEIFRAGLQSIGYGQREAALAIGMTQWQVMRRIILPQAIRIIIPDVGTTTPSTFGYFARRSSVNLSAILRDTVAEQLTEEMIPM